MRQAHATSLLSAVVLATLLLCGGDATAAPLARYTVVPIQDTSPSPFWPDTNASSRFAVNAAGAVVGTAWDYNGEYQRGFAWSQAGGFQHQSSLAPAPVGVPPDVQVDAYSEARGITSNGRIVGNYGYNYSYWQEDQSNPDGGYDVNVSVKQPVLWTPNGQGGYTVQPIANAGAAFGISPSGQHVAGQSPHWSNYLNQTVDGATRWTLQNDAWTENVLFSNWTSGANAADDLGTTAGFTNVPMWRRLHRPGPGHPSHQRPRHQRSGLDCGQ
ncbi:MAG: hypothetical protein NT049_18260 [Planctomycetota bacterium]|nr:hypothetical protein [Planctomycetota bacterium]